MSKLSLLKHKCVWANSKQGETVCESVEGRKLRGAEITLYTVLRTAYTASQRVIKFSEEHIRDYDPVEHEYEHTDTEKNSPATPLQ